MNSLQASRSSDGGLVAAISSRVSGTSGSLDAKLLHPGQPRLQPGRPAFVRLVVPVTAWCLLPIALTVFTVIGFGGGTVHFAGDFHYAFWPAGQRVLHGLSPYVDPGSPTVTHSIAFVYPALAALLLAPLALIPHGVADLTFAGVEIAAMLLTLRVLHVRDWRLYGLVLLCPAVYSGWTVANVTLLLGLGIATVWRNRERPLLIGFVIALLVSVKLFVWPLALWLLATRRYVAFVYAIACGLVLNVVAWAVLGLNELHRYSRLLHALTTFEERRGYSVIALALHEGTSHRVAYAVAWAVAAAGAMTCLALGRRGRDVAALALAIGVSLLATPIVQLHYFALLIVPFALVRPRLGLAWALPLVMWVSASATLRPWQIAVALAIAGAMVVIVLRRDPLGPVAMGNSSKQRGHTPLPSLDLGLVPPSASSVATGDVGR
jgi:hypothetical protein